MSNVSVGKATIFNEDCRKTMQRFIEDGTKVDLILTSPPYSSDQKQSAKNATRKRNTARYDVVFDCWTDDEYLNFSQDVFNLFEKILSPNGVVLYNMSYSASHSDLMFRVMGRLSEQTSFLPVDYIVWRKMPPPLPEVNTSNRLWRWTELVFVLCRKAELKTFHCNKEIASVRKHQNKTMYRPISNYIEARCNDGDTHTLNRATFSTGLVSKLLSLYAKKDAIVYDPFMGTGTTAAACLAQDLTVFGSEISEAQCAYAETRLKHIPITKGLFQ